MTIDSAVIETAADEQLVQMYKNGEVAAFDELYNRYKYIIKAASHSFYLVGGDNDDLLQEGFLGLLKAVNEFNGKSSFKNFAYICIRSKMLTAIKSAHSIKNQPLNGYISIYGSSVELNKLFGNDPEEQLIKSENTGELIEKINKRLSKFEIIVFKGYLEGLSYTEIGARLGKDPKSIDNALQRIKKKISSINQQ